MSKINVAITQREHVINDELYEALSTSWNEVAKKCGVNLISVSSYDEKLLERVKYFKCKAIILTGGGDLQENKFSLEYSNYHLPIRQKQEIKIIDFCIKNRISIIGVCRGMQILNLFFGGHLIDIENHVGQEVEIKTNDKIYRANMPKKVLCHHKKGISQESLAKNFKIIGTAGNSVENILDEDRKILGFMWHPERNLDKINKGLYQKLNQLIYG